MNKFIFVIIIFLLAHPAAAQSEYEEYFEKANEAFNQGRQEEAIKLYEKVLEVNPNFAPAYNALGKIYQERLSDAEGVAWYFKSAIQIEPDYIEAHENLGRWYQRANRSDLAEKHLKKVLSLDPNSISAEYALGWVYLLGQSKPQEAIASFERVLAKNKIPMAHYGIGLAYSRLRDNARVLEVITELKNLGQTDLASKLESSIRQPWDPSGQTVRVPVAPPASSSIVKNPAAAPAPVPAAPTPTTPIRLRGKLYNLDDKPVPNRAY